MEDISPSVEVRKVISECYRTITSPSDSENIVTALRTLHSFLDDEARDTSTNAPSPSQREEFKRCHYTRTLQLLVENIQADWRHSLPAGQRAELWDGLFLRGPPEQSLLVLMEGIRRLSPSTNLDLLVSITEKFLQNGRLSELLSIYCLEAGPSDSPQFRETLLGRIVALPDLTANKLHCDNKLLFLPQQYYPLLAMSMLSALERTCRALKDGTNCTLDFVARLLGKLCIQGHSGVVMEVMTPKLSDCTRSDMVWQRICWKLLENVPQSCLESVLTGLVQKVTGPDALGRIMGNLVVNNKKAQFVITHKLLLLQFRLENQVLRTILGYLAADRDRRQLLIQVLRSLSQTWANPSAVKHTPVEQQFYVSKTLLLCVSLLSDSELQELRSELLQCLLGGMHSHLDSSVVRIRHMGMIVGECLSSRMDIAGAKLKFEYEQDEETQELISMMDPVCENEPVLEKGDDVPVTNGSPSTEKQIFPSKPILMNNKPDSDLDSDDELTPYDMSEDKQLDQASPPRYLRDCLETLMSSEDPERVELSLRVSESLVKRNVFAVKEISVQLTKVLLHMEDKYSIKDFLALRLGAMVALTVTDCVPVTQYLTTEFYSLNYSLRQRLDILEILCVAAEELSKPTTDHREPSVAPVTSTDLTVSSDNTNVPWQQVVEKRVQSKTKYLKKGPTRPPAKACPNRYAPVAGHFFFPLLRNYDKPQVTFDMLGSDHLVLGKLIHTLGHLMHLAVNAPIATQMGRALLDFVWAVRYHVDQTVRRGVVFAVFSVFFSMPTENLMADLGELLFETRTWLADVAEGDVDAECRSLAVQSLVFLDKNLKNHLINPKALKFE
ncbi:telomere length regulation protein TEL2 homolog [Synchiropus splendidus]|uniref:telomere length regulation protein TEL2 homolog n=1 Tax=Synchiropus splendidus TaxID=270530 RepID=UPI00237E6844|nr:telomere length regulation protein TEL2 homolog [Synchiropus splendidus]